MPKGERFIAAIVPAWESLAHLVGDDAAFLAEFEKLPLPVGICFQPAPVMSTSAMVRSTSISLIPSALWHLKPCLDLQPLGSPKTADVLQRAVAWWGDPYLRDWEARRKRVDANDEEVLSTLSQEFFVQASAEGGGFEELADAFAEANRA